MGLGTYSFSTLATIRGISFRTLEGFSPDQIAVTGVKVARLVESFKAKHPSRVPNSPSGGGLLDVGLLPINDFELAQHLIAIDDPSMAKVIKGANGMPVLLAYLAILSNGSSQPPEHVLESALPFAVNSLIVESEVARQWNEDLRIQIDGLVPLANKGAKFQGKKVGALGPLAKAVKQILQYHPTRSAREIWNELKDDPPKGLSFFDNPAGSYVEYDKRSIKGNLKNTNYDRFENIVSERRKELKKVTV